MSEVRRYGDGCGTVCRWRWETEVGLDCGSVKGLCAVRRVGSGGSRHGKQRDERGYMRRGRREGMWFGGSESGGKCK